MKTTSKDLENVTKPTKSGRDKSKKSKKHKKKKKKLKTSTAEDLEVVTHPTKSSDKDIIKKPKKRKGKKRVKRLTSTGSEVNFTGVLHECTCCTRFFLSNERLVEHMTQVHSVEVSHEEEKLISSRKDIQGHLTEEAPSGVLLECGFCCMFFPSDERLVEHMKHDHVVNISNEENKSSSSQKDIHGRLTKKAPLNITKEKLSSSRKDIHGHLTEEGLSGVLPKLHECRFCCMIFPSDERLVEHIKQGHVVNISNEENKSSSSQKDIHGRLTEVAPLNIIKEIRQVEDVNRSASFNQPEDFSDDLKCNSCHVYFSTEETLNDHIEMHLCKIAATCPCCSSEVRTTNPYVRSVETQTNIFHTIYNCDKCSEHFETEKELLWHRLKIHTIVPLLKNVQKPRRPQIPKVKLTCHICNKVFKTLKAVENHQKVHQGTKVDDVYFCKDCNVGSPDEETHKRHLASHQMYACSECGKLYTNLLSLTAHFRWHDNVQERTTDLDLKKKLKGTFICDICGQTYGRKSHLIVHLKRHNGMKSYSCAHCNKKFYTSHNLKIHQWTHTGEKRYICTHEGCLKRFTQKSHLTYHIRTHKKEEGQVKNFKELQQKYRDKVTTNNESQGKQTTQEQAQPDEVINIGKHDKDEEPHAQEHAACPQEVKSGEVETQVVNEATKIPEMVYTQRESIFVTEIHSYSDKAIGGGISRHSILLRDHPANASYVEETVAVNVKTENGTVSSSK